ncbi:MAG TPA: TonB-dependent receptor [Thermoanaerobaculia bacterium]|nr:TonB-dependent receptor [Thermoanaerobaculia bacterium]
MKKCALALIALVVFMMAPSLAAQQTGRISGRVTNPGGNPIGGVVVVVNGTSNATTTDGNGVFRLEGVPSGTQSLQFTAGDFSAGENDVVVNPGVTTTVNKNFDWKLSLAESVTVYSASRRTERIVEAPAAVVAVSQETIESASPTGQLPKVIENAPGVDFTQSGLYDFNFNTRGFNSSLNRRILTLIDGRDPSVPFLGSAEWAALSYPVDEMASIELVRGPGSALYGANAFSGVLNMTTRNPKDSPGGKLTLTGGDLSTARADVRYAGGFGSDWFYRLVAGYQKTDDFGRSRNAGVEYSRPCTAAIATECLPVERVPLALREDEISFGGLRLDRHFAVSRLLTLEGGYAQLEGPIFQTGIGRVQVTDVGHPWARVNFNMPHWNFLTYYDARKAENQIALSSGASLWEDSSNIRGEVQTNWDLFANRARVVGGVAYNKQEVDTADAAGFHTLMPEAKSEHQQAAFGQVEFDVTSRLKAVVAARYDDSTLHEAQVSPKAALVYSITPNQTIRVNYNQAFQVPNYSEFFLRAPAGANVNLAAAAAANPASAPLAPALTALGFNALPVLARGNSALEVEKIKGQEIGYSGIFGGKVFVTADYYQSKIDNFVTDLLPGVNSQFAPYQIPTSLPAPVIGGVNAFLNAALRARRAGLTTVDGRPALVFSYANAGNVDTQGLELGLNYYVTNNWLVEGSYSWFDFEVDAASVAAGDVLLPNTPENKYTLGLSYRTPRFDVGITNRWVEDFFWAAGVFKGTVQSYNVVNLTGNVHLTDNIAIGANISNLADDEHYEAFGGDLLTRRALAYLSLKW